MIYEKIMWELTEEGEANLQDSGAKKYVNDNLAFFLAALKAKNFKSKYDVQEECMNILMLHKDSDELLPIKEFFYTKSFETDLIIEMMSVYLRDIALKELGFEEKDLRK